MESEQFPRPQQIDLRHLLAYRQRGVPQKIVWGDRGHLGRSLQPRPICHFVRKSDFRDRCHLFRLPPNLYRTLSRFLQQRLSASLTTNLCRIWAGFCNSGHLPVYYQICMRPWQISATVAICQLATQFVWDLGRSSPQPFPIVLPKLYEIRADFRNCGHLPVYYQIYMELGGFCQLATNFVSPRLRQFATVPMGSEQMSETAAICQFTTQQRPSASLLPNWYTV